jgi:O-antigen/teichoic acid export membrane protein
LSDRHASLYLVSRLAAAVLNLVSVAVFTRLASPVVFGDYLIGFAAAFIVFGGLFQWLMHAHFGVFKPDRAARLAGALLVALGAAGALGLLGLGVALVAGRLGGLEALGLALLVLGFVIHVGAVEVGRAHLLVTEVTAAGLLRGVLMLAMGTAALLVAQSAPLLLAAVGLAQALAAWPVLAGLKRTIWRDGMVWPERADLMALGQYGWPLIGALAAGAIAINLDRIVLGRFGGAVSVAAYGATVDVVRQGFVVLGEAIAAAYMSTAKAQAGNAAARQAALGRAFVTLWSVVGFGCVSWLLFGPVVLGLLLAPGYAEASAGILPLLVAGTALLALRAYYFGQVIYFVGSARREVIASGVMVAVAALVAIGLVPNFGMVGAGWALLATQAAGLASFLIADRGSRIMPVDWRAMGVATGWMVGTGLVALVLLQAGWAGWWAGLCLVLGSAAGLAVTWDLFGARQVLNYLLARGGKVSSRRQ